MGRTACHRAIVMALILAFAGVGLAYGQTSVSGTVEGRILDGLTGSPLPGARITIEGTSLSTSSDRQGGFRLLTVPPGLHVVVVTYVGRKAQRVEVTVAAGTPVIKEISLLGEYVYEEKVTVTAEMMIADAQGRALNQQRTAPTITNVVSASQIGTFPDANAAESAQRIPGVSIQRDQGEGRYVIIRGTEARLNSVMIDGERVPSPDPNLRQVAVDVIPSDLLQSIEVSKALTADMDADAIGGSVNLVMKQAPEKFRMLGSVGFGYNELLNSYGQNAFSVTAGRRLGGKKYGLILSGSSSTSNRGNQDMEVSYSNGNLADFDPRYYRVERRRIGFTGAFDIKQSDNSSFTLRGVYNRYIDDHENRQRLRERVLNSRIDRELRDRTHIEHVASLVFSGQQVVGRAELDYRLVGAYSDQDDPMTMTTTFRQSKVTFAPNVTPTSIDPNNIQPNPLNEDINAYTFNQQLRATNFAKERDLVGSANLRMPLFASGKAASFLKFGLKFRDKQKGRNRNENTYTTSSKLYLTNFLDTGLTLPPYLGGRYNLAPYISQALVEDIPNLAPMTITRNHARDAEEFDGVEKTTSGYVMAEIFAGPQLMVLPGFRYERTTADYTGREVLFSQTGAYLTTVPITSKTDYGVPLPSLHVRYAMTPQSNVRLALTRSLARPNFYDLVPYRAQNDSDNTIAMGNADLKPTKSWNVDLMAEHYFKSVGVVSAGFFYKRMQDYIYGYIYDQPLNGLLYHTTQPLNGEAATVRGFEATLQNQLAFLPSPLNGLGIYANYTFSDSAASFPNHAGTRPLPGQSRHVGNVALSFEKRGFSGRVSMNFHGSYVDLVGATDLLDRYYDTHKQLDVSVSQRLTKTFRVFVDANNLNDALLRYYEGVPSRPQQEEHYHWWATFGVKIDF